jgi:hypothetical protein
MIDLVVELMKTLDHGDSRLERDIYLLPVKQRKIEMGWEGNKRK